MMFIQAVSSLIGFLAIGDSNTRFAMTATAMCLKD